MNAAKKPAHTPGPWTAEIGMDALVRCPDGRSFNIGDAIYHEDNVANARLIATAPKLLAVCIKIASHFAGTVEDDVPLALGYALSQQLDAALREAGHGD